MPAQDTGLLETTEDEVDRRVLSCCSTLESCLVTRVELVLSEARDSSHLFLSALVGVVGDNGVLCLVVTLVSSREHRAVVLDLK